MVQAIYKNILFTSFIAMYIFGIISFLTHSPKGAEYKNYNTSRNIFSVAMIIWASYIAFQWCFNFRTNNTLLASTLNISCYYLGGLLLEFMFSSLLVCQIAIHKRIKNIVIKTVLLNAALCLNLLIVPNAWQQIVLRFMVLIFIVEIGFLTIRFFKIYRNALRKADNYYSDNVSKLINWMPRSIYLTIFLGFLGSVLAFAPKFLIAIYMLLGLILFTYIFISFQNYMINIVQIRELILIDNLIADQENSSAHIIEKENTQEQTHPMETTTIRETNHRENAYHVLLDQKIEGWVANKGFIKQGLTIEETAIEFGTNRTYLSSYINSTYNLSFRKWIALKRIAYSKELLCSDSELQLSKIAEMVGYSSSAFNAAFIKINTITPSQWRNENYKK